MALRDLFRRKPSDELQPLAEDAETAQHVGLDQPRRTEQHSGPVPQPSVQLAEGGSVSVSSEEHYQDTLKALRGSDRHGAEVVAMLVINDLGNHWAKKATGPVLEVKVDGRTVGFLTPAMSERYMPFAQSAARDGRALMVKAWVTDGTGNVGRDVEITLNAMPRWQDQENIAGLNLQTMPDFVLLRRTGRAHVVESEIADGGWITACDAQVTVADGELILRTKPYVGRVRADGSLFHDSPWWCLRCVPEEDHSDLADGGRFGHPTEISRGHRFSSEMNAGAVRAALRTRLEFDLAGESYRPGYPDNLLCLADVLRTMEGDEWLSAVLRRDPANKYDPNAIEVHVPSGGTGHCGFVPAELARILAPMLDSGVVISASAVEVRIHHESPDKPGLTVALKLAETPE
jgi:hypothetical protein